MQLVFLFILHMVVVITHAQRPFFAGSRPMGGLNQKDKYNHPELAYGIATTSNPSQAADIGNRFGSPENNNQSNGVKKHRPPVGNGLPIVYPEAVYEPLPFYQSSLDENVNTDLSNRFGGLDNTNDINIPTTSKRPQNAPFDARGDDELVKQLSQLPLDKQPFWFLNFHAIEAQRNRSVSNL